MAVQVTRKWATIGVLIELAVTVVASTILSYYFENKDNQLIVLVIFVGLLITVSTYILTLHVTFENTKQNEEQKKYLEIVKIWAELQTLENEELRSIGSRIVHKTTNELRKLNNGVWSIKKPHEIDSAIINFVRESRKTIKATHIDVKKWNDPINNKLFIENVKAIKRGIEITRVFIILDENIQNTSIQKIMNKHKDANIKVLYVKANKLPNELVKDFLIFDGEKSLIESLQLGVKEYVDATVSVNKDTLKKWEDNFIHIKSLAEEL